MVSEKNDWLPDLFQRWLEGLPTRGSHKIFLLHFTGVGIANVARRDCGTTAKIAEHFGGRTSKHNVCRIEPPIRSAPCR
jgi:hypothetical protein